jgi:hypothetical protein
MAVRAVLLAIAAGSVAQLGLGGSSSLAAPSSRIVLGSPYGSKGTPKYFCLVRPRDCGWGTPAPHYLTLGGDPSGVIWKIHWTSWGGPVATGRGLTNRFRPQGGYYSTPVSIQLRAYDVGRCPPLGTIAYRRMVVRELYRPGGNLTRWFGFYPTGVNWICGWR